VCYVNKDRFFIVSLTRVDWLTLGGLLLSCLGLYAALNGKLTLAISLMLLEMFTDMLDGFIARRMNLESEFGRHLDSFCDVFIYLALPMFILHQFGMHDWLSLLAFFIFIVCGLLRLSRFNMMGTVEEGGISYHLGMPVFWSHLLVVLAFPLWAWLGEVARLPVVLIVLAMSLFMIRNVKFPKPVRYALQAFIILSVMTVYGYLSISGIDRP
jgi:CDP-diacylglycerol--serine O-phosphatidyltransferase